MKGRVDLSFVVTISIALRRPAAWLAGSLCAFCPIGVAHKAPPMDALESGVKATFCQKAIVCIDYSNLGPIADSIIRDEVDRATAITSGIFASARVKVQWRRVGLRSCPEATDRTTITITLLTRTASGVRRGALAYSLLDEGQRIFVFYDRIIQVSPEFQTSLLGHVIAHEMSHILQRTPRHTVEGIMKAVWDPRDFTAMKARPLAFTETDLRLILDGLV